MLINLVSALLHWPEASWLVGSGGFVATFVDIDTLVVRQVVAARLFEFSWVVPPGDVTSHSDLVLVFRLFNEVFAISVLGPVDFSVAVWSGDQSWVGLGEAPEHVSFLAEAFNDPVKSVTGEFFIITAASFFTLLPRDQVVDVRHGVFGSVEEVFFTGVVFPTSGSGFLPVFHEVPSLAPFVFFQSSRVFVEAPWLSGFVGWFVAAPGVGETFGLADTIITALFKVEGRWKVGAGSVVGSPVTSVVTLKEGFFVEAAAGVLTFLGAFLVVFEGFVVVHTFDSGVWVDKSALGLVLGICVV